METVIIAGFLAILFLFFVQYISKTAGLFDLIIGYLVGFSALVHLLLGLSGSGNLLFVLNGLGFIGILGAIYLPLGFLDPFRRIAKIGLVVYSAITICAFILDHGFHFDLLSGLTALAEVGIIILALLKIRGQN